MVGRFLNEEFDGKAQHIILAHLSESNNHPDIARMVAVQSLRLSGDVLLWQRGEVTLRLESSMAKDRAIAIAASMR